MIRDIHHFHLFPGSGGGKKGFQRAKPNIPGLEGRFVYVGGIDIDAVASRDADRLGGYRTTVRDMADRSQYIAINGREPPEGWAEVTPADVRAAAHDIRPNVVFLSAPCKGFSGLLPKAYGQSEKYLAMNGLTLRAVWICLEAWKDDSPEFFIFENVPLIATRGRYFLDRIKALFSAYGYISRETTHDCGEIGQLAQSRRRFLLVARHAEKMPASVYEPPSRGLRSVGSVLDRMHLPGDPAAGPMHRVPRLAWKTWVRLAFVEAGSDWRCLNKLAVQDGYLRDYLIVPEMHNGALGVHDWTETAGVIGGRSFPLNGKFSISDPRPPADAFQYSQYGVQRWDESSGAVINVKSPGQGIYSVADPRHAGAAKHNNEFRIARYDGAANAITSAHGTGQCVADPRPGLRREKGDAYLTAGHYGVHAWGDTTGAVSASASHDNGQWSVADPRPMPAPNDKLVCRITALDGTWHRPFTTLELAALQSYYDPDDFAEYGPLVMAGTSDSVWREHIGNMVPPAAAEAMAEEIGRALLLSWAGETFQLSATPIWVRPLAIAIAVASVGPE